MTELGFSSQAPSQVARHFLGLLDDVYHIHGLFLEEITALRARIAELESSKTPFVNENGTVPSVPDVPGCAVYLVSQEGTIQSWSDGARLIYGYDLGEVLGRNPDMLRPDGNRLGAFAQKGSSSIQAFHRQRKDGLIFEVYQHHAVLQDKAGNACGRMHVEIPLENEVLGNVGTASGGVDL